MSVSIGMLVAVSLMFDWTPKGDPTEYDTETRVTQERVTYLGGDLMQLREPDASASRTAIWAELGLCVEPWCGWVGEHCFQKPSRNKPCSVNPPYVPGRWWQPS